jgi:hypothetical protein
LIGEELQGGARGGERKAAPLEVIGDLVLEPGRGAELPLRELLLQPIASDLAQRLHTRKGIDRITERANREGKRSGLRAGESDGLVRYLSGRGGGARHGSGGGMGSWRGKGIELRRKKTGGGDEDEGGRGGRETAAQSAIRPPFFISVAGFGCFRFFFNFFFSLSLPPIYSYSTT